MTAAVKVKCDELIAEGLLLQPRWGQAEDVGKAAAMLARGDLGVLHRPGSHRGWWDDG